MKLTIILLFAILLSACGEDICAGSDYTIRQGICIFTNGFGVNKEQLEKAIDIAEEETSKRFPKRYKREKIISKYSETSISFIESFKKPTKLGETEYNHGLLVDNSFKIKVVFKSDLKGCLSYYSVSHEMLHVFRFTVGDDKKAHPRKWFIREGDTMDEAQSTLEFVIMDRIFKELCLLR
jgi:hypothetical protein